MLVDPLRRRKVENAADDLQSVVDRAGRLSLPAPLLDPRLQRAAVDLMQRLQRRSTASSNLSWTMSLGEASLVLVFQHELGRSLLEGSRRPHAVDLTPDGSLPSPSRGFVPPPRAELCQCFGKLSVPRMRLSICQIPARMMRPGTRLRPMDRSFRSCGTPVAGFIVVHPSVEFKAIEADALDADRNFGQVRAHLGVEPVAVHAEVARRVTEANDARAEFEIAAQSSALVVGQDRYNGGTSQLPIDRDEASRLQARERAVFGIAVETELQRCDISQWHFARRVG